MLICFQFHLANLHTLMERTTDFGVTKCVVICSLSIQVWEIVENGMQFDSTDSPLFINVQIHKNAQATTVLLASLCRDEYHKVSGLDNAKQIWDTLKISHEGNDAMLTKMELVEGKLGRFLKTECFLIILTIPFSLMSKSIKMHKLPLFC